MLVKAFREFKSFSTKIPKFEKTLYYLIFKDRRILGLIFMPRSIVRELLPAEAPMPL